MRKICAALAATALLTGTAFAADTDTSLAPGKPAGLKQAQSDNTVLFILGIGVVAAGIALVASDSGSNNNGGSGTTTGPVTTGTQ